MTVYIEEGATDKLSTLRNKRTLNNNKIFSELFQLTECEDELGSVLTNLSRPDDMYSTYNTGQTS